MVERIMIVGLFCLLLFLAAICDGESRFHLFWHELEFFVGLTKV